MLHFQPWYTKPHAVGHSLYASGCTLEEFQEVQLPSGCKQDCCKRSCLESCASCQTQGNKCCLAVVCEGTNLEVVGWTGKTVRKFTSKWPVVGNLVPFLLTPQALGKTAARLEGMENCRKQHFCGTLASRCHHQFENLLMVEWPALKAS